ncbi:MAG: hypothetical protein KatS3mg131_2770 [Candidatus Tectimicrobiota bacterium]|nr:MAG: hypothetical protein KatS3mg131_2770 [Candidatus Tectomicrobia bacterium]
MGMTETLTTFAASVRFAELPPAVVTAAKRAFIDTLGVILAGAQEPCTRLVSDYCQRLGARPEATVLGHGWRTAAPLAALVNGTAGHALDYDDVNETMHGHPSIPILPAVLALGEQRRLTGQEAITAFVLGVEVECRLGAVMGHGHYRHGWHATATLGTLGAALAAARLLELSPLQMRHALGIATSMAAGSRQNFGTMTKPLHAGLAARHGLEAALLAASGFTADPDILESPMGFCRLFSPAGEAPEQALASLGQPWALVDPGVSVKKYPCCFATHSALDATLDLVRQHDLSAEAVQAVTVYAPPGTASILIHPRPRTGLEGKFSMPYCIAAALLDRRLTLATFTDAMVQRPAVQALLQGVQLVEDPEVRGFGAQVTLTLKDGRTLTQRLDAPRGDPRTPLSQEELEAKFLDCATQVLPQARAQEALTLLWRLEESKLADLAQLLA